MKPFERCSIAIFVEQPSLFSITYDQVYDATKKGIKILVSSTAFNGFVTMISRLRNKDLAKESRRILKLFKELAKHKMLVIYDDYQGKDLINSTRHVLYRYKDKRVNLFIDDESKLVYFVDLVKIFTKNKRKLHIGYADQGVYTLYDLKNVTSIRETIIENEKDDIVDAILQEPAEGQELSGVGIIAEPKEGEVLSGSYNEADHDKVYVNYELTDSIKKKLKRGPVKNVDSGVDLGTAFASSDYVNKPEQKEEQPVTLDSTVKVTPQREVREDILKKPDTIEAVEDTSTPEEKVEEAPVEETPVVEEKVESTPAEETSKEEKPQEENKVEDTTDYTQKESVAVESGGPDDPRHDDEEFGGGTDFDEFTFDEFDDQVSEALSDDDTFDDFSDLFQNEDSPNEPQEVEDIDLDKNESSSNDDTDDFFNIDL